VRHEIDELALQAVGVLELVDHDHAEPHLRRRPHRGVVAQQVASRELQILEVDRGLASLRRRVLGAESLEELLQQIAVERRQLLERRALGARAR
jgi:hypothetical protein